MAQTHTIDSRKGCLTRTLRVPLTTNFQSRILPFLLSMHTHTLNSYQKTHFPIAEEREDGLLGGLGADRPCPVLIRLVRPLPSGNIPPLITKCFDTVHTGLLSYDHHAYM